MKILFVIRSWGIGGEQRAASLITRGLLTGGHTVMLRVLSPASISLSSTLTIDPSVRVSYTTGGLGRYRTVRMVQAVRQQVSHESIDMVVGFGTNAAIVACLALMRSRVPVVVCERTDPALGSRGRRLLRAMAYRKATGAVFQTEQASNYFAASFFRRRTIIPNPVHPQARIKTRAMRRPVVVNHSRLTWAKNHDLLIRAFAKVSPRHPEFSLEIYGEGELEGELRALIAQLGLEYRVQLYDARPDILEKISGCEIFVLSSNHEGFPNSLAEAMCLGLACISTDCRVGGPRSMINDGINGRLVPVADVARMADALDELMSDPQHRARMGAAAAGLAATLDPEVIVAAWSRFLEEVSSDT